MPDRDSHETALRLIETLCQLPRYLKVITPRQLYEQLAACGFAVDIRTIQCNLAAPLARFDPCLKAADRALGDSDLTYRWADKVRIVPNSLALLPPTGDAEVMATVVGEALLRECCFTACYRNRDDVERTFQQVCIYLC